MWSDNWPCIARASKNSLTLILPLVSAALSQPNTQNRLHSDMNAKAVKEKTVRASTEGEKMYRQRVNRKQMRIQSLVLKDHLPFFQTLWIDFCGLVLGMCVPTSTWALPLHTLISYLSTPPFPHSYPLTSPLASPFPSTGPFSVPSQSLLSLF